MAVHGNEQHNYFQGWKTKQQYYLNTFWANRYESIAAAIAQGRDDPLVTGSRNHGTA